MATYATDLQTVNLADAVTGWAELAGHTAGAAPAADAESYIHNATAISQATGQAVGTTAGVQYDFGSNLTWTSGYAILVWQMFAAPTNIESWANGGMRIGIGSTSGNIKFFNALGDDFGAYPYGGWQNTAIDPEVTADATEGTPVAGNYRIIGSMPNMRAKITKGSPHLVDAIRYGRGQISAIGADCTFTGMATANDNSTTGRWGLFQLTGGGFLWKGLMSLGLAGSSCTFSDSNKSIRIEDTPRVSSLFNRIEVRNTGSSITWTSISVSGVQTSITGSAPVSPGDFVVVDDATVLLDGCNFTDMGTFSFLTNTTITGCTFRRCKPITVGGASISGCLITNPEVSTSSAAVVTGELDLLSNCEFVQAATGGHAVELTSIGDGSMVWDCVTTGYDAGVTGSPVTPTNTGDEDIYVSATTGTVTINVASGASTPSIRSAGATVNVVAGQTTLTLTGIKAGSEVRIYTAGTITELAGTETSTTSFSYTYTYAANSFVDIVVHHIDYVYYRVNSYLLGSGDSSLPISQISDRNYRNPT